MTDAYKKLKHDIMQQENRNKMLILLFGVFVAIVVVVLQIDWRNSIPDLRNYNLLNQEYQAISEELYNENSLLMIAEESSVQSSDVWVISSTEDPRLTVMQRLETIAGDSGINLRTAGNLKDISIADGLMGYELDVNADAASLSNVCMFCITLAVGTPKFFWDNLSIKPSGDNVVLSGKLKVLVVTKAAYTTYWGR